MHMSYMKRKPCNCMKGYMEEKFNECEDKIEDIYEKSCQGVAKEVHYNLCECGFEERERVFPENPMLAQSYVPWQVMDKTFIPEVGLKMGTIFPELVSPYSPGESLELMEYLTATNKIGEGCNANGRL